MSLVERDMINEILQENKELKRANTYNQSLINVYNTWFKSIGGIENVSVRDQEFCAFKDDQDTHMITVHCIEFPPFRYVTSRDERTIEALNYATKNVQYCGLCNDKRDVYAYYGGDINFCPKCGRIL